MMLSFDDGEIHTVLVQRIMKLMVTYYLNEGLIEKKLSIFAFVLNEILAEKIWIVKF